MNHDLTIAASGADAEPEWEARVEEGKGIIEKVSKLKYEMARDKELL